MKAILLLFFIASCYCAPTPPTEWNALLWVQADNNETDYFVDVYFSPSSVLMSQDSDYYELMLLDEQIYLGYNYTNATCAYFCDNGQVVGQPNTPCDLALPDAWPFLNVSTLAGSCEFFGTPGQLWTYDDKDYQLSWCFEEDQITPLYMKETVSGETTYVNYAYFEDEVDPVVFQIPFFCSA
eukprot:TRINITY_DN5914_c0_g1_i2.p1 TRINITY_DN5914_c0_g1~~TRINITY_DN5914_c0_g1_i2.p1  ORF type:complete len:195 (-),score=45.17 TRINITY_DN5914_c0_g1_i2:105-650(-)